MATPSVPTSLVGAVDVYQYGTIVTDVYEQIPDLWYPESVEVFASMRRDGRLTAALDGYGLQIRRAQWQVDGTGCRPEAVRLVADCLGLPVAGKDTPGGLRSRGVSWADHLRAALLCQVFGHYVFEMEAELVDGQARLMTLAERLPGTLASIHADPKTGALLGVDQYITGRRDRGPQITADRLVFYSRNREGAGWQGTSLIRPAYGPWLIKREMMRVAAISNRRWGAGVPVAEALAGTTPSPAQMQDAQRMVSAARAGDQAGAAVPPGFTMKIVGLSGSVPDTVGFIRFLNQEIAGSVLMPHLDLGTSESGSRALGESFIDSWTLALEAEAEAIADTITRQAAARIVEWNWGADEPVPRVTVTGIGSRREVTATSLQQLLASGALSADPRLEAWVRREYRLPERDDTAPARTATKPAPTKPTAEDPGAERNPAEAATEVAAAPATTADPVDYTAVDADYRQAVEDLTAAWEQGSGPLAEVLAAAVAAEVAAGMFAGVGSLVVPPTVLAALSSMIAGRLVPLAQAAATGAAAEIGGRVRGELDDATQRRVEQVAQVTAELIAAGYTSGASRVAMSLTGAGSDPEQARRQVAEHLAEVGQAKRSGLVSDNMRHAVSTAQAIGREHVLRQAPAGTRFRASERLDRNTCGPCRRVDGTEYDRLDDALIDYPSTVRYRACEGRHRCRGLVYPIPGAVQATAARDRFARQRVAADLVRRIRVGDVPWPAQVQAARGDLDGSVVASWRDDRQETRVAALTLASGGTPTGPAVTPARRLLNLLAEGSVTGPLHRGMHVAGSPAAVAASFPVGSLLPLPVVSFTRDLASAATGAGPGDDRPAVGVPVILTVTGDVPYAVDLADIGGDGEVLAMGHTRITATVLDDTTGVVYVDAEPVLVALQQPQRVDARRGFDPSQPRDRFGRWTDGPGGGLPGGGRSGGDGGRSASPMTDAEFAARQEMVERVIGDARKQYSTDVTHTTADGAWTPQRDRLHREMAAELYAKAIDVPRDGKAVIAGGLGGAGKSTVLNKHARIDQSQYLTLNPDDVKELMAERGLIPDVPGHPDLSPMERAALVHEESSRITKLVADMAYRDKRNVIWDITMSSEGGAVSRLADLDRNGYTVQGVFVDIPVEVSVERALSRYRRGADQYRAGKGQGGRYVPPAIIRAQRTSGGTTVNREVFERIRDRFGGWAMYDNSVTGRPAQRIGQS